MAVDQRIQTTITAGRGGAGDADQGPIMVILLSCLAVAMCFTTLGMGFVNIASGTTAKRAYLASLEKHPAASATPTPQTLPPTNNAAELEPQKQQLDTRRQLTAASLDERMREMAAEQLKAGEFTKRLQDLNAENHQIAAQLETTRTKMSGDAAEEQRQLQIRTDLDRKLLDLKKEIAAAGERVQELQKVLAERKSNQHPNLVVNLGDAVWVECVRDGVVFLPEGKRVSLQQLSDAPNLFLAAIGNRPLQFLVRPDGFHSFEAARNAAEQHGVASLGYEPVNSDWRLRFRSKDQQP